MIVTGTPQDEMEHILKAIDLESPFSKVFGAPHTKPKVLAQMLAETKMEPEECLMIGDSMTDHDAAVENQVRSCCVRMRKIGSTLLFLTDQKCPTSCIGFIDCFTTF